MLHNHQGSNGIFVPFAYAIAATDVAANAVTTSREAETDTRMPSKANSLFANLRDFAASITRWQQPWTA